MVRERQLVRIVADEEGHERKVHNVAEMHRAGTVRELEERRRAALARIEEARAGMARELDNVNGIAAFRGDDWSIMHILWHLSARDGGHMRPARDIVLRGVTDLGPVERRDEKLAYARDAMLADIDSTIEFVRGLTAEQLAMKAKRQRRDYYVIGIIESVAEHLIEHLEQIQKVKRRIGLEVTAG